VIKKRLVVIELNEFNEQLLEKVSSKFNLKNIHKFLNMNKSETISLDNEEHFGLDPWVQWVSIHTGCPHNVHQIDHLADVKKLKHPQIWETIGEQGFSSGVWGAMNASRNNAKGCAFFLPDPWTYSEQALPNKLNDFLALPRYFSKNYLSFSIFKILSKFLRMLKFMALEGNLFYLRKEIFYSIKCLLINGLNDNLLFSLFDLFSTKIFLKYKNKFDPNLTIIFLNCLAHAQHKEWLKTNLNKDMEITIKTVDRILGMLFNESKEKDALIILNGLGQKNIDGDDYCIYRQINPELFLRNLEIKFLKIEQCMTNESHVTFNNLSDLENAKQLLNTVKINGEKLFFIEKDTEDKMKLFFQINFFKLIEPDSKFYANRKSYDFYKYFSLLAKRTGVHTPYGSAYSKNFRLKRSLYNHEIFQYIANHFN